MGGFFYVWIMQPTTTNMFQTKCIQRRIHEKKRVFFRFFFFCNNFWEISQCQSWTRSTFHHVYSLFIVQILAPCKLNDPHYLFISRLHVLADEHKHRYTFIQIWIHYFDISFQLAVFFSTLHCHLFMYHGLLLK